MGRSNIATPRGSQPVSAGHLYHAVNPNWDLKRRRLLGIPGWVDAAPIRAHVQILTETYGLSCSAIARAAGVVHRTVDDLLTQPDKQWVHYRIAPAILAVDWRPHPAQPLVLAIGARRRGQGMAYMGWSLRWQEAQIGAPRYMRSLNGNLIVYELWAAVRDLYDERAMTEGPNRRSASDARRKGWAPPLAWDDDDIDNPLATVAAVPKPDLPLTTARKMERQEQVRRMLAEGMDVSTIASRLGVDPNTVGRDRVALREAA